MTTVTTHHRRMVSAFERVTFEGIWELAPADSEDLTPLLKAKRVKLTRRLGFKGTQKLTIRDVRAEDKDDTLQFVFKAIRSAQDTLRVTGEEQLMNHFYFGDCVACLTYLQSDQRLRIKMCELVDGDSEKKRKGVLYMTMSLQDSSTTLVVEYVFNPNEQWAKSPLPSPPTMEARLAAAASGADAPDEHEIPSDPAAVTCRCIALTHLFCRVCVIHYRQQWLLVGREWD
ncbi:MAG: hypothetical protein MHM6MM_003377 [Cercozoa sp. M6MM]